MPKFGAPESARRSAVTAAFGLGLAVLAILGFANESAVLLARRRAMFAQAASASGEGERALDLAERALRMDGGNTQALYIRAVRLKSARRADELLAILPQLLAIHPNQASVRRLAGEQQYLKGDNAAASDALWGALWISPTPPASPANFWRMAMAAGRQAGRNDMAIAAALRAAFLVEGDPFLKAAERQALYADCAGTLRQLGFPATAAHLGALAAPRR